MNDTDLARRLAQGDADAFAEMAAAHRPAVQAFLRHLTRRREDAEDLAQDALLRARAAAERFDGRASFRAWLLKIAYREFLRWRRRRPWLPLLERQALDAGYASIDEATWLLALLAQLPVPLRTAFLLHEVQGLSVTEIAEVTEAPEGTVKYRLHEARKRMRELGTDEREKPEVNEHVVRSQA